MILLPLALRATTVGSMGLVEHLSPLPGTVVRVVTSLGATVRTGDPIVILESMKMEHVVAAKATGTITSVSVTAGDAVGRRGPPGASRRGCPTSGADDRRLASERTW